MRIIKGLFKKYSVQPIKKLGQHFLVNKKVLEKIIESANLQPNDIIFEIGPGIGVLTQELVKKTRKVIAIEKDPKMIEILKEVLNDFNNVEIVQGDILKINPRYWLPITGYYKVVANLPYYIVSPVIRKFLESKYPPKEMILMVQKEVAQRICSKPPDMNLLAVSVQFYSKPEIIAFVSKKSFWPQPKVDSAIIKITVNRKQLIVNRNLFFKVVKASFSQPRKQILNNLSKGLKLNKEKVKSWLLENNILPTQRAETLSIQDWLNLAKTLK